MTERPNDDAWHTLTHTHTEAVALIAAVLMEMIRDGNKSVAELMDLGRSLLGHRQVGARGFRSSTVVVHMLNMNVHSR